VQKNAKEYRITPGRSQAFKKDMPPYGSEVVDFLSLFYSVYISSSGICSPLGLDISVLLLVFEFLVTYLHSMEEDITI
jgi:hypothetical protein